MPATKRSVQRVRFMEFFARHSRIPVAALGISLFILVSAVKYVSGPDVVFSARHSVREVDVVARLGGDEFALLLPETDAEAARLVLNEIEDALRQGATVPERGDAVGFSAGAVTFERPLDSVELMIQYADRVMYSVKQNGKGRVVQQIVA